MRGYPRTPCLSAASGTLDSPEHTYTDTDQASGKKQRQKCVTGHHRPNATHQTGDGVHAAQNGSHSSCNSFLKSFHLSKDFALRLDAGAGIEPTAPASKSGMLPLHYPAIKESRSSHNLVASTTMSATKMP